MYAPDGTDCKTKAQEAYEVAIAPVWEVYEKAIDQVREE